jgi:hypothetical protein
MDREQRWFVVVVAHEDSADDEGRLGHEGEWRRGGRTSIRRGSRGWRGSEPRQMKESAGRKKAEAKVDE